MSPARWIATAAYITQYKYDAEDRLSAIVYPSGRRVEYERDILGRATAVRAEVNGTLQAIYTNIAYQADNRITRGSYGGEILERRSYDRQGRLMSQRVDGIVDQDMRYDPFGNLVEKTESSGATSRFEYDALTRLIEQERASGERWQYGYGSNGNRIRREDASGLSERYGYEDAANRLREIKRTAQNNLPDATETRSFDYNRQGRVGAYSEDGETVVRYTYNALGERARRELVDGPTSVFTYSRSGRLLAESDQSGTAVREYIWLGRRPVAVIAVSGGVETVRFVHTDQLGTARGAFDRAGAVVWRHEGEAFGASGAEQPTGGDGLDGNVRLRFPGQYFDDPTGLHYNYFRLYDPELGRYVRPDPIGLQGGSDLYSYGRSNPLTRMDEFGLVARLIPKLGPIAIICKVLEGLDLGVGLADEFNQHQRDQCDDVLAQKLSAFNETCSNKVINETCRKACDVANCVKKENRRCSKRRDEIWEWWEKCRARNRDRTPKVPTCVIKPKGA